MTRSMRQPRGWMQTRGLVPALHTACPRTDSYVNFRSEDDLVVEALPAISRAAKAAPARPGPVEIRVTFGINVIHLYIGMPGGGRRGPVCENLTPLWFEK